MTDLSAAYVAAAAALGGSALTAFSTFGIDRLRERRAGKGARKAKKVEIYSELLIASAELIQGFTKLRLLSDVTSRWLHGLRQALRTEPAVPSYAEIFAMLQVPMDRLMNAWSRALLVFDQEEIAAVNELVFAAQQFDMAKPASDTNSIEALIGAARIKLAEFARTKLGEEAARIAYSPPKPAVQPEADDGGI